MHKTFLKECGAKIKSESIFIAKINDEIIVFAVAVRLLESVIVLIKCVIHIFQNEHLFFQLSA